MTTPKPLSDEKLDAVARRVINTANGNFEPGDWGAAIKMLHTARDDRARLLHTVADRDATIARLRKALEVIIASESSAKAYRVARKALAPPSSTETEE